MPFSCSSSRVSIILSLLSLWVTVPVISNIRSASVDLPWSIWAIIVSDSIYFFHDLIIYYASRNLLGFVRTYLGVKLGNKVINMFVHSAKRDTPKQFAITKTIRHHKKQQTHQNTLHNISIYVNYIYCSIKTVDEAS